MKNDPAYLEIYNDIYLKILNGEYSDGEQLPSEIELCKKYFVSRITMRKALSILVEKGFLTRIAGKGSFINQIPKMDNIAKKAILGIVLCDFASSYGVELIKSIEYHADRLGYNILLKNSRYNKELEEKILKSFSENEHVKGIILQPVHGEYYNPEVLNLSIKRYPLVLIDRNLEGISLPYVGTDNRAITERVMDYLIERGHKNIAFISSNPKHTTTLHERFEAIIEVLAKQNTINMYRNHFLGIKSSVETTKENIERDIQHLTEHFSAYKNITCIFAAEYSVCRLVKAALKRLSMRVPEDVSLVSFDNVIDPFFMNNTACICQNEYEIGKRATELLVKTLAGENYPAKIYISANFIDNGSIKRIN